MAKQNNSETLDRKGQQMGLVGQIITNVNEIVAQPMKPEILNQFLELMDKKTRNKMTLSN